MSALLFLYREVLDLKLPWLDGINRPAHKRRIPSVLTRDEVAGILAQMAGLPALLAHLLYGTGMRLMEAMRLRIKDIDFERHVIIVRDAKGGKDRVVMLPRSLAPALRRQMLAQCAGCGEQRLVPHSCGHRSCPHCQHFESQRWIERQSQALPARAPTS